MLEFTCSDLVLMIFVGLTDRLYVINRGLPFALRDAGELSDDQNLQEAGRYNQEALRMMNVFLSPGAYAEYRAIFTAKWPEVMKDLRRLESELPKKGG